MAQKRAILLILLLLALSTLLVITLLVTSLYLFKSNPVKQKGNAQKISLTGLADTTENIHLGLVFNNINLQDPGELVGKIQYLWGPYNHQPLDTSIYTSAYVPLD